MRNALLTFLFAVGVMAYSFGQYPNCTLYVTNTTGHDLGVGVQTTKNTFATCPSSWASLSTFYVPAGAVNYPISLGVAISPAPPIRPFRVGCFNMTNPSISGWQINTCWNPSCVANDATYYTIDYTLCTDDYETYVTIY